MANVTPESEPEYNPIEIDVENICVAEPGSLPQTPELSKNVIFSGEGNKVYIRPFTDLKITTITNVTLMMGMVSDMDRFYYSIPCMPYNQYTKNKPFPHGTITSVRAKGKYRGEPGGSFPSSVMINIWASTGRIDSEGKHICSKVSAKITQVKIQMCGVASYEMGLEISHEIVRIINSTLDLLILIRKKPLEYSTLRQWVSRSAKGHICKNPHSDLPPKHLVDWNKLKDPPKECEELCKDLFPHVWDQMFYEDLVNILNYHATADPGKISDFLQVRKTGLSMTNYNYMLGFKIDRQVLYEYLKASKMNVVYDNAKVSYVLVRMTSRIPNGDSVIRRDEQNGRQTFMIQESGRIMHSGPETIQMATCYYKLMGMIATIRDQIASNIPSLQEFLSSSQTSRRGRRKKNTESDIPPIYDPYGQSMSTPNSTVNSHRQDTNPCCHLNGSYSSNQLALARQLCTPPILTSTSTYSNDGHSHGHHSSTIILDSSVTKMLDKSNTGQDLNIYVPPQFVPNINLMYNNEHCQIIDEEDEDEINLDELNNIFSTTITPDYNEAIYFED